eukprot:UN03843
MEKSSEQIFVMRCAIRILMEEISTAFILFEKLKSTSFLYIYVFNMLLLPSFSNFNSMHPVRLLLATSTNFEMLIIICFKLENIFERKTKSNESTD